MVILEIVQCLLYPSEAATPAEAGAVAEAEVEGSAAKVNTAAQVRECEGEGKTVSEQDGQEGAGRGEGHRRINRLWNIKKMGRRQTAFRLRIRFFLLLLLDSFSFIFLIFLFFCLDCLLFVRWKKYI